MEKYCLIQVSGIEEINSHKEKILSIWNRNLPKLSKDRFDWVYKSNPYGLAKTIIAQSKDTSEYVGCGTVYPRVLYVNGKAIRAGIAVDFAINKEHRVFGPAVMIQRKILDVYLSEEFDMIFAYPNGKSEGVFRRVGYSSIGEVAYWTKILHWNAKLIRVLKIRILAGLAAFCVDSISMLIEMFHKMKINSSYTTKILSEPTKEFNTLWEKAQKNYLVIGEKKLDYLQWRYSAVESKIYKFFCMYNEKKELCAYIVYEKKDDVVIVCDLFAEDIGNIKRVMVLFIGQMRQLKYMSIVMLHVGDAIYGRIFRELLFIKKRNKRPMVIFLGNNLTEQEKATLLKPNKWHLCDGELDL